MFLMFWCLWLGQSNTEIKVDYVEKVIVVNLPLRVSRGGETLDRLKPAGIGLRENGIEVAVQDIRAIETELTIHFLFDLSTSHSKAIFAIKKAARDIIRNLRPQDRGKVSFFSAGYQTLTEYTDDHQRLIDMTASLSPIGTTALYDGLAASLEELSRQRGNRLLLVFSDGHDLLSSIGEADLTLKVKNFGIPILMIGRKRPVEEKPLLAAQNRFMHGLIKHSGGRFFEEVHPPIREINKTVRDLRKRYLLIYAPPNPENTEQWRSLFVRVRDCPDCRLEYRRAYRLANLQ